MMQQLDKLPDMDSVKQARSEAESKLSSNLVEKIVQIEQSLPAKSVRAVKHTKQKRCFKLAQYITTRRAGVHLNEE